MLVRTNYSLRAHNTFGLSVLAQSLIRVETVQTLLAIFQDETYTNTKKIILGGGSNVLFTRNFLGLVIHMAIPGISIKRETSDHVLVEVGAGENWHQLVLWAIERNLGGIENLSLIPGTVGAAPMQNIGAYGVELQHVFHSLQAFEILSRKLVTFFKEDCAFGYRYSQFKGPLKDQFIITKVCLKLNKRPQINTDYGSIQEVLVKKGISAPTIKDVSQAVIDIRRSKLPDPLEIGNAGSFFKNPVIENEHFQSLQAAYNSIKGFPVDDQHTKVPAAWLIDQLGWKGYRDGQVGVHDQQPLVLVNHGDASGQQLLDLSEKVKASVQQTFGIDLEREVNVY